ncbi:MAG: M56 family metallopeptidase [Chitinophagaceae bacterium]|jgi:beta-lactamase regulating signal transducer with metallopeptidase domain
MHYLINCSAIWLLSLVCFDLFLRRSSFHSYSRFYLLCTLAAGIFIPLLSFQSGSDAYQPALQSSAVYATLSAKENLIQSASAVQANGSTGVDWLMILNAVYLLGVLISLVFLLRSAHKIYRLVRKGKKACINGFSVIETEQAHGPFSFFGFIFISSAAHYSAAQLSMILAHENRHNRFFHSFDLLFAELCKTVFWFHPLPYFYKQRLLMVHEFQADTAVQQPITEYGAFLVEQSFVQNAPGLSHSFLHSPLKKRMLMLTHKSPAWAKSKMLIAIPVVALSILCCSKDGLSRDRKVQNGNKVTFKGNVFELKISPNDTVMVEDLVTKELKTVIGTTVPFPIIMNGDTLPTVKTVDKVPVEKVKGQELLEKMFAENVALFSKLDDGEYRVHINQVVVGANGKLLYYKYDGIEHTRMVRDEQTKQWTARPVTPVDVKDRINDLVEAIINKMSFEPAIKNGKAVPCYPDFYYFIQNNAFTIKNHELVVK